MSEAEVNGELVVSGPDAPDTAIRPDCGTEVNKRHVTRMDVCVTYFYRHKPDRGRTAPTIPTDVTRLDRYQRLGMGYWQDELPIFYG